MPDETRLLEAPAPSSLGSEERPAFPTSFAQQRLWFLDQLDPGRSTYNLPLAMRLRGALDFEALEESLGEILRRHDALRTVFALRGGAPVQVIKPPDPFSLVCVDLTGLPASEREQRATSLTTEESVRPFDLALGPLFRAKILRLSSEDHILVITMHHIVSDGWSIGVLLRELSVLYAAFCERRPAPLPELPIQYADYAIWQRQWIEGETLEEQTRYWKKHLAGAPPFLELPTDRPRGPVQTFAGASETVSLPSTLMDGLKQLAQSERATLFMTMLAAFHLLLARSAGQDDVSVGCPIAGRTQVELEDLIGFFVNTLVLRADVSADPTFRELLRQVREAALGAYAHQEVPFEKLVEKLNPIRSASHSPLFQVMFQLRSETGGEIRLRGLTVERLSIKYETAQVDLSLFAWIANDSISCSFNYNTDLFDSDTIRRALAHYRMLLEAVVADPDRRVSELPLLTSEERQRIVVDWNRTEAEFPRDRTVPGLVEETVGRHPDAIAVEFGEERITYRELNERSNRLARELIARDAATGTRVALCLERSPEMLVALLGILKSGAAYVPLDPTYPRQRLRFMLEDSQPVVLVTDHKQARAFPWIRDRALLIDRERRRLARIESGDLPAMAGPEDLAYVLYTSGSSGHPKGVEIRHRSVVNFLASMERVPGLVPEDKLLAVTTLSFDIAGLELYLPLAVGARLRLATRETASSGPRLAEEIERSAATVMQATPATWRMLLDSGWAGKPDLKILSGGEALSRELANQLLEAGREVWNLYGPTETTIWSTVQRVEKGRDRVSIGRPIANTTALVLDRRGKPVPIGVPGELLIGGEGVAKGYWNRPELTSEKFIPSAFHAGQTLYRTGDLARQRPDGSLDYLGRIDDQVKIRGFRIELAEIESALRQHPAVEQAVAAVREYGSDDRRLIAYLVGNREEMPQVATLREFLRKTLPDAMIPAAFVILDELPLTPNGKIDRRALPAPDQGRPDLGRGYVAPSDSLERHLVQIWETALGIEHIGVRDNFFELGGHSLLAVRVFNEIENSFDRKLPLATIFEAPTISELAAILRQEGWSPSWSSLVAIQPRGSRPPFYCIHAVGGNVLTYVDLSRYLGLDQPVYGLQAVGLDGSEPLTRIEDMAAHYIAEIRKFQPEGPYYLGGTSAGGLVAFEMAQQLVQQGAEVAVLALFDTWGPDYPRWIPGMTPGRRKFSRFFDRVDLHVGNMLAAEGLSGKLEYLGTKTKRAARQFALITRAAVERAETRWRERSEPMARELKRIEATARRATERYVEKVYPGRLTLFRASKQPMGAYPDSELGWTRVAGGGVEVYEVPGYHGALVHEPRIRILAEQLSRCLEKSHAAHGLRKSPEVDAGQSLSSVKRGEETAREISRGE